MYLSLSHFMYFCVSLFMSVARSFFLYLVRYICLDFSVSAFLYFVWSLFV